MDEGSQESSTEQSGADQLRSREPATVQLVRKLTWVFWLSCFTTGANVTSCHVSGTTRLRLQLCTHVPGSKQVKISLPAPLPPLPFSLSSASVPEPMPRRGKTEARPEPEKVQANTGPPQSSSLLFLVVIFS